MIYCINKMSYFLVSTIEINVIHESKYYDSNWFCFDMEISIGDGEYFCINDLEKDTKTIYYDCGARYKHILTGLLTISTELNEIPICIKLIHTGSRDMDDIEHYETLIQYSNKHVIDIVVY